MYLYFDVNGNLKEIINYPVRESEDNVNSIFVYFERTSDKSIVINSDNYSNYNFEEVPIDSQIKVFMLPELYDSWQAVFKIHDSDELLNSIPLSGSISESYVMKQIPFDKDRDLKFFKYYQYYQFVKIDLTSQITVNSGRCDCTVSFLNTSPYRIKPLDTFSFFIQTSVVIKDVEISTAQYQYLYAELQTVKSGGVPYDGAVQDVNLGTHAIHAAEVQFTDRNGGLDIPANDIALKNDPYHSENKALVLGTNYTICISDGDEQEVYLDTKDVTEERHLVFPDKDGTIAVTDDLSDFVTEDDLSDYVTSDTLINNCVPYQGADKDVNIEGNDFYADDIYSQGDIVATQLWVGNQGYLTEHQSLEGLVPYTGATDDLDLGSNNLKFTVNQNEGTIRYDGDDMYLLTSTGDIILNPDGEVKYGGSEVATKNDLPKKGVIGTFNTGSFTDTGSNYVLNDIPLSGFISGSDLLIITWGGCFAICPIPISGPGRVAAALWNSNGESQVVRIKYELKSNNTLLDISLAGGFTPPSNFDGYIINYKIV